jgi:cyclopropane fatty-acyl-phospholipid synthase-like methyltransferase
MTETMSHQQEYLPGMGRDGLLWLYDPLTRLLGVPRAHGRLLEQVDLRPGQRVLEIGCGTGNLALLAKRRQAGADVVGLDPDPQALARAARKARRRGLAVQFDRGFAGALPYADASFDRVLSAFMFHHLAADERPRALAEVVRTLRPGGSLHLLDFGGAKDPHDGLVARMSHSNHRLEDNFGDRIPALMREAGLTQAHETGHRVTRFGRYTLWAAARPAT